MAKSWKDKKKDRGEMDDLFDRLLKSSSNCTKVTGAAVLQNNTSSSEAGSDESSDEILFRSPLPVRNSSKKKEATSAKTKDPAMYGGVSRSCLTASTPRCMKTTSSYYAPDLSPIAAESYQQKNAQLIHRYVDYRKQTKEQAAKERIVVKGRPPLLEIKEKPEEADLCSWGDSCVILESPNNSHDSANPLPGYESIPLLHSCGVPETDSSDPEGSLSTATRPASAKAILRDSCTRLPSSENLCHEARNLTEVNVSDQDAPLSPPSRHMSPKVQHVTYGPSSSSESVCEQSRSGKTVQEAMPAAVQSTGFQSVRSAGRTSSSSASTPTSLPDDKLSEHSGLRIASTKSPEYLFARPVVPGKRYRRSLGFSDSVKNRRQTEAVAVKVPRVVGRKSCLAIRDLLPYYHVSLRKSTIIRAPPLPLCDTILEKGEELNEKEEQIQDGETRVLSYCSCAGIISFQDLVEKKMGINIKKIGEGVYGEVFGTTVRRSQEVVKILPVNGEELCNGEPQKKFEEVLSELMISKALSNLSSKVNQNRTENFVKLTNVHVVQGEYPTVLLNCWDEFDAQEGSENWRPEFPIDQKYLVLGLQHGGESLEKFEVMTEKEAGSVFLQIAYSLAVAEIQWQFEHRDLHAGNILLKKSRKQKVAFMVDGSSIQVACNGYIATIIDFTLSRAQIGPNLVFCDLSTDDSLFEGSGDYQFDIYRMMREHNKNDWSTFRPRSNALWLHYLGKKLLEKIQGDFQPSLIHQYLAAVWEASGAASFVQDSVPNLE